MNQPLSRIFSSTFSSTSRERGAAYHRAGRVDIRSGNAFSVNGRVRGSSWYAVEIAIEEEGLFIACACPYYQGQREPCKHLWATILEAEEMGMLGGDDEPIPHRVIFDDNEVLDVDHSVRVWIPQQEPTRRGRPSRAHAAQPKSPTSSKPTWEKHIGQVTAALQSSTQRQTEHWPAERELYYLLDLSASRATSHLVVEVMGRDRVASGAWGKLKPMKVMQRQIPLLPDVADRHAMAGLVGARDEGYGYYNYSYNNYYNQSAGSVGQTTYRLPEALQPLLLPDLCATGRCLVRDNHNHTENDPDLLPTLAWDGGEPWQFHLVVSHHDGGYRVSGEFRRGDERRGLRDPLLIFHSGVAIGSDTAFAFNDDGAFPWIAHLRSQGDLDVPADQADHFLQHLMSMSILPKLDVPEEMRYEEVGISPRPVLRVRKKRVDNWGPEKLIGELSFEYEEKEIPVEQSGRGIYDHQTRRLVLRDHELEAHAVARLAELGFKDRKGYYGEAPYRELAPKKLPRVVQQLMNAGWRVEAEGKLYRTATASSVQVKSGIDWFELHGTVDFDGVTAQLPALLAALRKGENTVLLDDGTFGLLPEQWLAKIGAVAGMGKVEDDHMRFSRAQVGLLDALLMAQPEADVDAAFQHAREELMRFKGIEPMDPPKEFTGTLRPYQQEGLGWLHFLRRFGFGGCLADSMGLGKCVAADTLIAVNGSWIQAENIWEKYSGTTAFDGEGYWSEPSQQLIANSINEESGCIVESIVRHLYRQRLRERMRRITLEDGSSITITRAHKLLTDRGWRNELEMGDRVGVPSTLERNGIVDDGDLVLLPELHINESYSRHPDHKQTQQPAAQQIAYSRVQSIEDIDYDGWVYDFEIADHHNFVANGILCHNTIQVLALLESRRQEREEREREIAMAEGEKKGRGKGEREKGAKKGRKKEEGKKEVLERIGPSLAVVPKSLIFNWRKEAERFTPHLRVLDHTGNQRLKTTEHFEDYDLILTTYGTLLKDVADMKDIRFDYAILDEAQAIKNPSTASAKASRLINADHRLALSGTPVENHLGELWSIFEFLNPGLLGTTPLLKGTAAASRVIDEESLAILRQALRPFILRRTKEQVAKDLPPKLEQTIYCELDAKQRKQYDQLRAHYRDSLLGMIDERGMNRSKIQVLEALLRLRQAACHPGLIDKKRTNDSSAKLDVLMEQIEEVMGGGGKALIFSQFTTLLGIVRKQLDKAGIIYEYLDGKTRDRQARVDRFQNDDDCKLFLISLKAGGVGLNLTAADHVYLLDPWWNPAVEAQAIDRTHRIGQHRQVFARRIIARDTVEEKVLELQKTKRDLADAIITADNSLIRNLGREDLELLLS